MAIFSAAKTPRGSQLRTMPAIDYFDGDLRPVQREATPVVFAAIANLSEEDISAYFPLLKREGAEQVLLGQMLSWLGRAQAELDGLAEAIDLLLAGRLQTRRATSRPETLSTALSSPSRLKDLVVRRSGELSTSIARSIEDAAMVKRQVLELKAQGASLKSADVEQIVVDIGNAEFILATRSLQPLLRLPLRRLCIADPSYEPSDSVYCGTWQEAAETLRDEAIWRALAREVANDESVVAAVRPDSVIEVLSGGQMLSLGLSARGSSAKLVDSLRERFAKGGPLLPYVLGE